MTHEIKCPRCAWEVEYETGDTEPQCGHCGKIIQVVDPREALRDKLEALAIECAEYDPEVGESDFAAIGRELAELREAGS